MRGDRCGDCGVIRGGSHHPGCDLQRCPACGRQLMSCGCSFDEDGPEEVTRSSSLLAWMATGCRPRRCGSVTAKSSFTRTMFQKRTSPPSGASGARRRCEPSSTWRPSSRAHASGGHRSGLSRTRVVHHRGRVSANHRARHGWSERCRTVASSVTTDGGVDWRTLAPRGHGGPVRRKFLAVGLGPISASRVDLL